MKDILPISHPYDTVIKNEKRTYAEEHRSFLDSYILKLKNAGYDAFEISKIMGRSVDFVGGRLRNYELVESMNKRRKKNECNDGISKDG